MTTAIKQPITVAELIAVLQQQPPDAFVMFDCDDCYYDGPLAADDVVGGGKVVLWPYKDSAFWASADPDDPPPPDLDRHACVTLRVNGAHDSGERRFEP